MFLPTLLIGAWVLPILGQERFGVLITILSLLAFLGIADLGVGASLVTSVSRALGQNDAAELRRLHSNGLAVVCAVAVVLLLAAMGVAASDAGSHIFPSSRLEVRNEATRALAMFLGLFALTLPLSVVARIQLAMRRGHVANLWQIAAALINFAAGALAARAGLEIAWIVAGLLLGTLVCGLANVAGHYRKDPQLKARVGDFSRPAVRAILRESSFFLALQVIFTVAYAADTLIVAHRLGATEASVYGLAERLFSIVAVAVSVITAPLWAAYGEALGAADGAWVARVLRRSTTRLLAAAAVLVGLLLASLHQVVDLLSAHQLVVPFAVAAAMGLWRVIEAAGSSVSAFMYANRSVGVVLALGTLTALVSFVAKVVLVGRFGMIAMPLVMSATYLLLCLLPTLFYLRRAMPGLRAAER